MNEEDLNLLVSYSIDCGEGISEAIIEAFLVANIQVYDKPTQLADWINTDVFEDLQWSSDHPLYLCTLIWDQQVVITAEEIRIYTLSQIG